MLAVVNTPHGPAPVEIREIAEPNPGVDEALVEVRAFSFNRGELSSFARNREGWVPGQDVAEQCPQRSNVKGAIAEIRERLSDGVLA